MPMPIHTAIVPESRTSGGEQTQFAALMVCLSDPLVAELYSFGPLSVLSLSATGSDLKIIQRRRQCVYAFPQFMARCISQGEHRPSLSQANGQFSKRYCIRISASRQKPTAWMHWPGPSYCSRSPREQGIHPAGDWLAKRAEGTASREAFSKRSSLKPVRHACDQA